MSFQLSGQTSQFLTNLKISAILLKYPSFGGVFCAVQGLAWVPGVPDICGISGHHLWQPQIFEVLCANWHPQALFYRTDRTRSFKFLTSPGVGTKKLSNIKWL